MRTENGQSTLYVYGLSLIGAETEGVYHSYHFDYRGSTVALTDEQAQVVQRFAYGPYGELLSGDVALTPFLFNGMFGVMSEGNGLYFMRARFYSPQIKRFVNRDVLVGNVVRGQSLNRFAFVAGQVINSIDPWGLLPLSLERAVEIIKVFLTEYYNDYASPKWGNLTNLSPHKSLMGKTDLDTGRIIIDNSLNVLDIPRIRKEIEQCGKLTPEREMIYRKPVIFLLETVIHEFIHSTVDVRLVNDYFLVGHTYLWWDNFFYERGFTNTWHNKIYLFSRTFAEKLYNLMFLSDAEWELIKNLP